MAKKFVFELESALRLKTYAVQKAKEHLAQIIEQISNTTNTISDLQSELASLQNNLPIGKQSAIILIHQWQYQTSLVQIINKNEKQLQQLNEIAAVRQKALVTALQDEKIYLKLKEKKQILHKNLENREEQLFLDEIGQQIAIRNRQK
ncbi:MAG: flagellar FliJ family protein [Candidatus Kapabacteria bacterium]|nr:flagellar FliJ family protein [Candidatus Kapabacteria bacterium]